LTPEFVDFEEEEILLLMADGDVTVQDLVDFGDMLNNLLDILVAEGKDY
jgi:hypothetical protein